MLTEPYSIYVESRPMRIAFLIGVVPDLAVCDRLMEYCRRKWGGRFNPFVLTDGQTIEADWWALLRELDPDIVVSLVPLDSALRTRIYTELSPLEVLQATHEHLNLSHEPLSVEPSGQTIATVARDFGPLKSALALFDLADTTPPVVREFVARNFGLLPIGKAAPFHLQQMLAAAATHTYQIGDVESLNAALLDLGEYHRRVVFASQMCSLPGFAQDTAYSPSNDHFCVVVGDSIDDVVYSWNRALAVPAWLRNSFTQLWLPSVLARDPALRPGLAKFLNRFVGSTGNQNAHGADFVSFSQTDDQLRELTDGIGAELHYPRSWRRMTRHPSPTFQAPASSFSPRPSLELHRAHATEEYLSIPLPAVDQSDLRGQYWFVDLYVQLRPERFRNISGTTYWWRFPQRNAALAQLRFVNKPARVRANGCPTALVSDRAMFGQDRNDLHIRIPEDRSVAYALLCGPRFDSFAGHETTSAFSDLATSDKGRYLRGVLELFPDLLNAGSWFRERYWRTVFQRMVNQSTDADSLHRVQLTQALAKQNLEDFCALDKQEARAQWLAGRTLSLARDLARLTEKELVFDEFLDAAKRETEAYNQAHPDNTFDVRDDDIRGRISDLLESGVLLVGIKPKCPRCGYRIWYHLDRVAQRLSCEGCGYGFVPSAEQRWYYKLNSLVAAAVAHHGTIPVLLVLDQLMSEARNSFLFVPPTELYGASRDKPVAELDLICLRDGHLIVGEVKTSTERFKKRHFEDAVQVAMEVRPHRLLFAALDGELNSIVRKGIESARSALKDFGIDVEWYALRSWINEPSPVR